MKLTKQQKIESSKALAEKLKAAPHLFFTEFQGMKFVELDELRMQLKPLKCRYAVVKNSLVKYALKNAGVDGIDPKMLKGPGRPDRGGQRRSRRSRQGSRGARQEVPAAQGPRRLRLREVDDAADCDKLSKLPSKQELMGKVVGLVYTLVSQSVAVVQAPTRDAVWS